MAGAQLKIDKSRYNNLNSFQRAPIIFLLLSNHAPKLTIALRSENSNVADLAHLLLKF